MKTTLALWASSLSGLSRNRPLFSFYPVPFHTCHSIPSRFFPFIPSLFGYPRFFLCPDIVYNLLEYGHADHLFRSFTLHQIDTEMLQAHISRVLGCVLPRESLQSGPLLNAPLCQRFLDSQAPRFFGQGVKSGFFVIFRRLYRLGIDDNVWPGDNGFTLGFCVVKCISQWTAINYKRTACIKVTLRRNLAQLRHKVLATKLNETRKSFQALTKGLTKITNTSKRHIRANERRVRLIMTRDLEEGIQLIIISLWANYFYNSVDVVVVV